MDRRFDRLLAGFSSYQEFFVKYLTAEGLIERGKADLLKGELRRVAANPLTREEVERLKELIEKELTLEALLGKLPAGSEYGTPETWKLHLYASIWTSQKERSGKRIKRRSLKSSPAVGCKTPVGYTGACRHVAYDSRRSSRRVLPKRATKRWAFSAGR